MIVNRPAFLVPPSTFSFLTHSPYRYQPYFPARLVFVSFFFSFLVLRCLALHHRFACVLLALGRPRAGNPMEDKDVGISIKGRAQSSSRHITANDDEGPSRSADPMNINAITDTGRTTQSSGVQIRGSAAGGQRDGPGSSLQRLGRRRRHSDDLADDFCEPASSQGQERDRAEASGRPTSSRHERLKGDGELEARSREGDTSRVAEREHKRRRSDESRHHHQGRSTADDKASREHWSLHRESEAVSSGHGQRSAGGPRGGGDSEEGEEGEIAPSDGFNAQGSDSRLDGVPDPKRTGDRSSPTKTASRSPTRSRRGASPRERRRSGASLPSSFTRPDYHDVYERGSRARDAWDSASRDRDGNSWENDPRHAYGRDRREGYGRDDHAHYRHSRVQREHDDYQRYPDREREPSGYQDDPYTTHKHGRDRGLSISSDRRWRADEDDRDRHYSARTARDQERESRKASRSPKGRSWRSPSPSPSTSHRSSHQAPYDRDDPSTSSRRRIILDRGERRERSPLAVKSTKEAQDPLGSPRNASPPPRMLKRKASPLIQRQPASSPVTQNDSKGTAGLPKDRAPIEAAAADARNQEKTDNLQQSTAQSSNPYSPSFPSTRNTPGQPTNEQSSAVVNNVSSEAQPASAQNGTGTQLEKGASPQADASSSTGQKLNAAADEEGAVPESSASQQQNDQLASQTPRKRPRKTGAQRRKERSEPVPLADRTFVGCSPLDDYEVTIKLGQGTFG